MTNDEAIFLGTQKFLESNKEWVGNRIEKGVELATAEIAASIGLQIAARVGKFMENNKADLILAYKEMSGKALLEQLREKLHDIRTSEKAFDVPKKD
jgi:hypothetical protein